MDVWSPPTLEASHEGLDQVMDRDKNLVSGRESVVLHRVPRELRMEYISAVEHEYGGKGLPCKGC